MCGIRCSKFCFFHYDVFFISAAKYLNCYISDEALDIFFCEVLVFDFNAKLIGETILFGVILLEVLAVFSILRWFDTARI